MVADFPFQITLYFVAFCSVNNSRLETMILMKDFE